VALQELEDCLWKAGKQIVSGLNTGEPLSQASHAPELASQQCWQKVIGVGYTDKQKRDLIYRHVAKAMDCVRNVTGADAIMAKQLVDLLHARVHAGEHRRVTAASLEEQREQRVCAAITGSLAEFVSGLHAAGGAGRYPDKVTKAMHVSAVAWPWVSLLCTAHCLAACVALANSSRSCAPSPGRALAQVVATAVSNAAARNGVSYKEIGQRLGLSAEVIGKCKERFDELQNDGKWEQLFDDRGAVRNDVLPEERKKFALQFWTDAELLNSAGQQYGFVRYSERAKDEIRDPANRTSKETFRIAWLEARVGDVYEAMKKAGVAKWPDFHMSQTVFSELRPFYVKDATRETCMCIYHMRWDELCSACTIYRHKLRAQNISTCKCCVPKPKNGDEWRKKLICSRDSDQAKTSAAAPAASAVSDQAETSCCAATSASSATQHSQPQPSSSGMRYSYDNLPCVQQECEKCKNLSLFDSLFCEHERGDVARGLQVRARDRAAQTHSLDALIPIAPSPPPSHSLTKIKFERFQNVTYTTKDGTQKVKKDFVSVHVPFSELEQELREFFPKFIAHHNDAKWHDDDFAAMITKLQRGQVAVVIDFAENYTHEARFENQAKYFMQVCCCASESPCMSRHPLTLSSLPACPHTVSPATDADDHCARRARRARRGPAQHHRGATRGADRLLRREQPAARRHRDTLHHLLGPAARQRFHPEDLRRFHLPLPQGERT